VVDMAGVAYISSVGLRALMMAAKQTKVSGGKLAVAALQPVVKEIFEISRFNFVVKSFATPREAIVWMSPADAAAWDAAQHL
jgi:anti-anti-sigma factor